MLVSNSKTSLLAHAVFELGNLLVCHMVVELSFEACRQPTACFAANNV
jgi:hypothetical protein